MTGRRRNSEAGFTIVEAVIAAMVFVVGALAALTAFDAGTRNTYRAGESQVVVNRLQSELEKIEALPYTQVAMSATPTTSSDQNDPRSRVSGTNFVVAQGGTESAPMVRRRNERSRRPRADAVPER